MNKKKMHYVYICKKLPEANENLNNFDLVYKELEQEELEGEEDDEEQAIMEIMVKMKKIQIIYLQKMMEIKKIKIQFNRKYTKILN